MGQDEFQFDNFNKTPLVGLEAVLPNAYCNAVIQVSISSNREVCTYTNLCVIGTLLH